MSGKIVLVTGGARSGKSSFAERLAGGTGPRVAYLATAQALDAEMAERIALHQRRRPSGWQTFECPLAAETVLPAAAASADAVLFDCLTVYISNLMFSEAAGATPELRRELVQEKIGLLLTAAQAAAIPVVFVTNEVGQGIVPDNALAREYRDLAGLVNQQVAAVADEVYWVICGLAVDVKKLAVAMNEVGNG